MIAFDYISLRFNPQVKDFVHSHSLKPSLARYATRRRSSRAAVSLRRIDGQQSTVPAITRPNRNAAPVRAALFNFSLYTFSIAL